MSLLSFTGFKKKPKAPWSKYYGDDEMELRIPNCSIYNYFENKILTYQDKVCIDYYGKKIKYSELLDMIDECAKGLSNLGIKKGNVVTICLPNTLEGVVSCFASNKIGAIVNFIHPASSENEIKDSINEMESKVIIAIDTNYLKLENIIRKTTLEKIILVSLSTYMPLLNKWKYHFHNKVTFKLSKNNKKYITWQDFMQNAENFYLKNYTATLESNDPSIILNSGGTTGSPKGVVLSNGNLIAFIESAIRGQKYLQQGDTCLALMPIFHGFGIVHSILFPLCNGMNVILRPKFDVKEYCKMIIKYRPQILMGVPTLFESLISEWNKNTKLDFVKCVLVGGDTLKSSLRNQINEFLENNGANIKVCTGYGLSEAVCGVALGDPGLLRGEAIGIPLPGIYVGIFSNNDEELPYGEEGEICVCGPTVMLGYYNNEKETNIALHVHKDGNVWLHTGDIGVMDDDGYLTYTNRSKRMIISSGYNVYPNRIEKLLESHPAVMLCSVVGIPHKHKMEVPKAFIVLNKDYNKSELLILEFKKLCRKNLPKYAWPYDYQFMEKLPTTKVGKIDFKKLQESNNTKDEEPEND